MRLILPLPAEGRRLLHLDQVLSRQTADRVVISHEMLGNRPALVSAIAEQLLICFHLIGCDQWLTDCSRTITSLRSLSVLTEKAACRC